LCGFGSQRRGIELRPPAGAFGLKFANQSLVQTSLWVDPLLLAIHRLLPQKRSGWRALPPTKKSGAPMTYGYIEDLKFAVEVFDEGGNLKERGARALHSLPREVSGEDDLPVPGWADAAAERSIELSPALGAYYQTSFSFQHAEKIDTILSTFGFRGFRVVIKLFLPEAVMCTVVRSHPRVYATLIFARQIITPSWAQEHPRSTALPPYPDSAKITLQWDYSCPGGRACSFSCPGRGGAAHVTKLAIYLGTISFGSQETPSVFYEFSTVEIPRGTGFALAAGLSTLSCQVNGMTLDYSGPFKRGSPRNPTTAR
jgi:hypothetical protein